jgi:stage II sporulation protein AA (anti-sigma F factor antagonist)
VLNHTVDRRGGEVCVALAGEVDLCLDRELSQVISQALAGRPTRLVFDLASVTFIGCSSIGILADADRAITATGGQFQVVNAPEPVAHVLRLLGLQTMLPAERTRSHLAA